MTTGMPDFGALLAQAQQMQQQMMDAQQGLGDLTVEGTAGGGLVTAVVNGRGDLESLTISPAAYDADDPEALETLADLVVAAVRDAKSEAERQATEQISAATSGLAAMGASLGGSLGDSLGGLLGDGGVPGLTESAGGVTELEGEQERSGETSEETDDGSDT